MLQISDALVVATEHPEFREIDIDSVDLSSKSFAVFDANCFIKDLLFKNAKQYYSVGVPVFEEGEE